MKLNVKFHLPIKTDVIDLEGFGHEPHITYEDLTEEQRNEIADLLRSDYIVGCSFETIEPMP